MDGAVLKSNPVPTKRRQVDTKAPVLFPSESSHARGHRFEFCSLHHRNSQNRKVFGVFLLFSRLKVQPVGCVPQEAPVSPGPSTSLGRLEKRRVHHIPQPSHIALEDMSVYIERGRNIAVPQPCLNVLHVTTALAQGIHRAVPQVVEADNGNAVCHQHPPEVVGHKIRVNRGSVRLCADIPAVGVVPAKSRLFSSWRSRTSPR